MGNDKARPYTVEEAERDALAEELDSAPLGHFDAAQVVATAKALANETKEAEFWKSQYDTDTRDLRLSLKEAKAALATSEAARAQAEKERDETRALHAKSDAAREEYRLDWLKERRRADGAEERLAFGGVKIHADGPVAAVQAVAELANQARDHANDAVRAERQAKSLLRDCLAERDSLKAQLADAALSSPAPSVVRLEEVDALLVDLLNEAQSYVSQHDLPMMRTNFGFRLSLWKQKQGGGQ